MKDYEDEAFDELEKKLQKQVAHGITDGSLWRKRQEPKQDTKNRTLACPSYLHDYTTPPPHRTEQNFCQRCGKRTKDLTHIHTCTPPQEMNT